jgi:hypothetical protein
MTKMMDDDDSIRITRVAPCGPVWGSSVESEKVMFVK